MQLPNIASFLSGYVSRITCTLHLPPNNYAIIGSELPGVVASAVVSIIQNNIQCLEGIRGILDAGNTNGNSG
jgi:hypothetical protein